MTDVESDLPARLDALASDLTGPDATVSAPAAIARYRQRRRTRVALTAATDETEAAEAEASEAAAREAAASRSAQWAAASTAAQAAAQPGLDALVARLGAPVSLSSPAEWDRWLPGGEPFPGVDLQDDLSTCPVLSARLGEATGREMSYWTGTLPNGPAGCTWVPVPLVYDTVDHDTVVSVGFLADGTTVEDVLRSARQGPGQGTGPCPWTEAPSAPGGAVLLQCTTAPTTGYTLAVPDSRLEGGLWFLDVSTDGRAPVPAADVLPALVEGMTASFG